MRTHGNQQNHSFNQCTGHVSMHVTHGGTVRANDSLHELAYADHVDLMRRLQTKPMPYREWLALYGSHLNKLEPTVEPAPMQPRPAPAQCRPETYEHAAHTIKAERLIMDVPRKKGSKKRDALDIQAGVTFELGNRSFIPRAAFRRKDNAATWLRYCGTQWRELEDSEGTKHPSRGPMTWWREYALPTVLKKEWSRYREYTSTEINSAKTDRILPLRLAAPEPAIWKYQPYLGAEPSWKCPHGHGAYTDDRGIPYCTGCQDTPRLKLTPRTSAYAGIIYKVGKERGFRWQIPDIREDIIADMWAYLWEIRDEMAAIAAEHGERSKFTRACVKTKLEQYLIKVQVRATDITTPSRGKRVTIHGADGKELPWGELMAGPDGKLVGQDGSRRHTGALGTWDEEEEKGMQVIRGMYGDFLTEIVINDQVHPFEEDEPAKEDESRAIIKVRNDFDGLVIPVPFMPSTADVDVVRILAKLPHDHRKVLISRHSGRTWPEVALYTGIAERTTRRRYAEIPELVGVADEE